MPVAATSVTSSAVAAPSTRRSRGCSTDASGRGDMRMAAVSDGTCGCLTGAQRFCSRRDRPSVAFTSLSLSTVVVSYQQRANRGPDVRGGLRPPTLVTYCVYLRHSVCGNPQKALQKRL